MILGQMGIGLTAGGVSAELKTASRGGRAIRVDVCDGLSQMRTAEGLTMGASNSMIGSAPRG